VTPDAGAPRPVVPGFHPDPSIVRVGDTYWMVVSSFEYAPGVPLFRSTDLRSWEQVGHVLARPSQLDVSAAPGSGGITAPTLRHHDGRFWMITTNLADGGWQTLVSTEDPLGEWSEPVRMTEVRGIDPDLAWDDDGTLLVTYAGFGAGGPAGLVIIFL
jgi:xylan 1,4-beta-xylosidase